MKRRVFSSMVICLTALLGATIGNSAAAQNGQRRLVVVELFTSQGCNSCPPADAYLAELARRDDILALSLHVDYWDHLGWKDTFASRACTERQRAYSSALSQRYVYTPQMVIDGRYQGVGSERAAIRGLIERALKDRLPAPSLAMVNAPPGPAVAVGQGSGKALVWRVMFDRQHTTPIARGENAGKSLAYHNVVRDLERLGEWSGQAITLPLNLSGETPGDRVAVLLQAQDSGHILSAMAFDRPR